MTKKITYTSDARLEETNFNAMTDTMRQQHHDRWAKILRLLHQLDTGIAARQMLIKGRDT